jgi:AAHS family 4-hydroxybenzoate transporter-like MFS transporter
LAEEDQLDTTQTGSWTAYQKAITLLAAIAVIFDGFDIQVLGIAIPSIMRDWHVARAAFAPIAALGLAGMACGSPFAGYCGDRFGRRTTLIGCVLVFASATFATAFCHTLLELTLLRIMAGAGVGGALPNASALTAEFAPLRRRALAVTLTVVCIPLGGTIAGFIAARVLPAYGWRALYMIGGIAPLLVAILMFAMLPESPSYLAGRRTERTGDVRMLWSPLLRRDTLGLWISYFFCLGGIYLVFSWLPSMLSAHGLNSATASNGIAAYNFGGVFGVLICAVAVTAWGSRGPMLWCSAAGAASAIALLFIAMSDHTLLIAGIGLHGFFVNAVQTVMYALASHVYPTRVRASGIAWGAALGRVGGIFSSLGGAAIIQAGSSAYFGTLAVAMVIAFIGLAVVRNHCPGAGRTDLTKAADSAV